MQSSHQMLRPPREHWINSRTHVPSPQVTCPAGGKTTESVLQPPREDSEVLQSPYASFREGCPCLCPAGGRAPAAPLKPVRESAANRAPVPGLRLPRFYLLGPVLAAPLVTRRIWEKACSLPKHTSGGAFRGSGRGEILAGRGV